MKEELPESIIQRKMKCIQSNLLQADTKKKRPLFTKKKINNLSQNIPLSVVLQLPLGNLNAVFLI